MLPVNGTPLTSSCISMVISGGKGLVNCTHPEADGRRDVLVTDLGLVEALNFLLQTLKRGLVCCFVEAGALGAVD